MPPTTMTWCAWWLISSFFFPVPLSSSTGYHAEIPSSVRWPTPKPSIFSPFSSVPKARYTFPGWLGGLTNCYCPIGVAGSISLLDAAPHQQTISSKLLKISVFTSFVVSIFSVLTIQGQTYRSVWSLAAAFKHLVTLAALQQGGT